MYQTLFYIKVLYNEVISNLTIKNLQNYYEAKIQTLIFVDFSYNLLS